MPWGFCSRALLGLLLFLPIRAAAAADELPSTGSTAHIFEKIIDSTGVSLAIPVDLVGRDPKNGTWGHSWASADLSIDTLNFANKRTIEALYNSLKGRSGRLISGDSYLKPEHSFVLTGSEDRGTTLFYIKAQAQNGELRGLSITYNSRDRAQLDSVVQEIIRSFDPFPSAPPTASTHEPSNATQTPLVARDVPQPPTQGFERIIDPSTGVALAIPLGFVGREPTDQAWGRSWSSDKLSVDTLNFGTKRMIDELFNALKKRAGRLISSSDFKPEHSFILAGSDDDGTTRFYIEVHAQNGELRGLSIAYNTDDRAQLDNVVREIVRSFVPFPSGQVLAEATPPGPAPSVPPEPRIALHEPHAAPEATAPNLPAPSPPEPRIAAREPPVNPEATTPDRPAPSPPEQRIAAREPSMTPEVTTADHPAPSPPEPRIAAREPSVNPEATTPDHPAPSPPEPRIAAREPSVNPEATTPDHPAPSPPEPRIAARESSATPDAATPDHPAPSPPELQIAAHEPQAPETKKSTELPVTFEGVELPRPHDNDELQLCPKVYERGVRVALVIGNGDYTDTSPLPTPPVDADAVTAKLKSLNFDVVEAKDLNRVNMHGKILEFIGKLDRADNQSDARPLAVFFYAGHGVQVKGENYLLPIDARIQSNYPIAADGIPLSYILGLMAAKVTCAKIIFLDACRNIPKSFDDKELSGLAPIRMRLPETLIEYSTSDNEVAIDSLDHGTSPFTSALLGNIKPGLKIQDVIMRLTAEVERKTDYKQIPTQHGSLGKSVVLMPESLAGHQ
jgi:hypothetical protein